ncbi:hypothetical protein Bca52824_010257 [Brassica carinata]|uniref:Uncharacterized protein n=1 Tax=Brassica carinata TaxID=52824 RepID=A0A8X7WD76_BRACI|nr:hypothetical protein Bca52824_010257 [Brassica carinata]
MECRLELKKGSSDRPPPAEKKVLTKETQKSYLPAKFRDDKRGLSYSDFHREITKKVEDVCPKRLENRLKSRIGRTASGERDLVKYKSYVPSYVKKCEARDVKAGGIGSGDLRISAKEIGSKNTMSSLSNTSTSSSLWTDESSTDSSKGLVHSPFRRRINHPPLQYYLMSSKPGDCSQDNGDTSQNHSSLPGNITEGQRDTDATKRDAVQVHQSPRGTAFLQNEKKDSDVIPSKPDSPSATTRVISRNLADDFNKKGEKLDDRIRNPRVHDMFGKEKPAAVFVPGIVSQKQILGLSKFYDSKVLLAERVAEANRKGGFPERLAYGQRAVLDSDVGHFRREADGSKPFLKRLNFLSAEKNRSSSAPRSRKSESSPSRSRTLDRRSTETLTKLSDQKPIKMHQKEQGAFHHFADSASALASQANTPTRKAQTPPHYTPSRAGLENRSTSSLSETSSLDSTSAGNRGRSSPLRRLLDPLIRPKSSHACRSPEPSSTKGSPSSSHQKHILSDGQSSSSTLLSRSGKSSTVQALFRVTSKNDQPLFTFAVDKEQSITAATIRKQMIPEKEECGHKYTFFTVQEVQKKNGKWMNHSRKVQGQEYTSNIVAQMRRICTLRIRVAAAPNELAAMVIKIPKFTDTSATTLGDVNTTVVLPSGIHSLPHKGGPSSLIQRWKSGGSCDCGGWDMGCNLRILTSESNLSASTSDAFKLFCQGGLQDNNNQPFLSFTPYREGVYAVEYNTSLSLLQAFSICIAVNEGRNPLKTAEANTWRVDNKACGEVSSMIQNERLKSCSGPIEGEAPAKYVSNPPVSPVGRV